MMAPPLFASNRRAPSCASAEGRRVLARLGKAHPVQELQVDDDVVRLATAESGSGKDFYVAVVLADRSLIIHNLNAEDVKRTVKERLPSIPDSIFLHQNILPTACSILVSYGDEAFLYDWINVYHSNVVEQKLLNTMRLQMGTVLNIDKAGRIFSMMRIPPTPSPMGLFLLTIDDGHVLSWASKGSTFFSELFDKKQPPTSVNLVDNGQLNLVDVAVGNTIRRFGLTILKEWKEQPSRHYPSRILELGDRSMLVATPTTTALVRLHYENADHELALKHCMWEVPTGHSVPTMGELFCVDGALCYTALTPAIWSPRLHAWATPYARKWVSAFLVSCPLPIDLAVERLVPLALQSPAHEHGEMFNNQDASSTVSCGRRTGSGDGAAAHPSCSAAR